MKSRSPPIKSQKTPRTPKKTPGTPTTTPKKTPGTPKKTRIILASPKKKQISVPKMDNAEEKKVLEEILKIKIPEKFYAKRNLVLGDLLKAHDNNLMSGITKALFDFANFAFRGNIVINTLVKIIALILSNTIPSQALKTFIVSNMLKIINTTKATGDFIFAEIYLKLFNKEASKLSYYKKLSFSAVLPLILGSFVVYSKSRNERSVLNYIDATRKGVLSETSAPFVTETSEFTGETNKFLVSENIVKEGETTVRLEKLGINTPEISKLNPKGIGITFNPIFGSKKPINLRFIAKVPYLDDSEKYLAGDVGLVKTTKDLGDIKEKLTTLVKFYEENLGAISSWYIQIQGIISLVARHDDLVRAIGYTLEDMRRANDTALKIEIYENLGEKILQEGLTSKGLAGRYGIPEQAISNFAELKKIRESLLLSGINTKIKDHIQAVLEAGLSNAFVNTLRSNLNLINDTRKKLLGANRDIKLANLKNINLVSLRVEDATSVISSAIQRIKKYDTTNPVDFFKTKIEPIVINTQTKK